MWGVLLSIYGSLWFHSSDIISFRDSWHFSHSLTCMSRSPFNSNKRPRASTNDPPSSFTRPLDLGRGRTQTSGRRAPSPDPFDVPSSSSSSARSESPVDEILSSSGSDQDSCSGSDYSGTGTGERSSRRRQHPTLATPGSDSRPCLISSLFLLLIVPPLVTLRVSFHIMCS